MVIVYELPYFSKTGFLVGLWLGFAVFLLLLNTLTNTYLAAIVGLLTVIAAYYSVKHIDSSDRPTLTYMSEEDVEKIRACLIKQEDNDTKEGVNNE